MRDEDYEEDWYIEGKGSEDDNYVTFAPYELSFKPMPWHNLLGHVSEWRAELKDWQVRALESIADEDGWGMKIDWGVFRVPCHLTGNELVVNTEGVW